MSEKRDRVMRLAGFRPDGQGGYAIGSGRTWRVERTDGSTEDITALSLTLSAQDTATFHDGGPLLVLTREDYRSIRLVPPVQAHGDIPPCSTCKDTGAVEVVPYGEGPCPDCTKPAGL